MTLKKIREYESKEKYIQHQISKTSQPKLLKHLKGKSKGREAVFKDHFEYAMNYGCLKAGYKALCMGARSGEEVRALKSLRVDAIGIDLYPLSKDVIEMDFLDLRYEGETFDMIYSNSMDHAMDLDGFLEEAFRCLKNKGFIIFDVFPGEGNVGECEVYELDVLEIIKLMCDDFFMELCSVNAKLKRMYRGDHKETQLIFRKGTQENKK